MRSLFPESLRNASYNACEKIFIPIFFMGTYNTVVKYLNTLWGTKETITTIRRSMRSIVPTSSRRTSTLSLSLWDYLVLKFEVQNRKRYNHDKIRAQPKVSLFMIINKITINDIKNLAVKWPLGFCTFTDNKILCHSFIMCWYSGQNLFASSPELSEFIEDMGRFLHFSDPCDDKDSFSDSSNVNIGGPQILQILFAIDFKKGV